MYYTIYKTINKLNGKYYIGKHQTENLNDFYIGSGKVIKEAIKKYGKKNFIKEILFVFDNEHDMNLKEKELVTEELISKSNCYNSALGGEGGPHFKGKTHTEETKQKIKQKRAHQICTEETRKKIGAANKKRIITEEFRKKMATIATGRKKSPEEIEKIRKARISRTVTTPATT